MNVFEGNVVLTKGTIRITADRIVVRQDAEGFQYATATGKPVRFRQKQDPKDGKEGVWVDGEALRIEVDEKNSKVEMFDSARVSRDGDEVAGNYIMLDQTTQFFTVGAGKGPAEGRVRAVIQPKAPASPPTAAPAPAGK